MATKDLIVATWVQTWDPKSGRSVTNFLKGIEAAAELGNLGDKDKVRLVLLKVQGAAQNFLDHHSENTDSITYSVLKRLLIDRFKEKHSDFYHYARLQSAKQESHETPEDFADRLRHLSKQTLRSVEDAQGQAALMEEAERRLVAIYMNGLRGNPGLQVRYQLPDTLDKAVKIAMMATLAEADVIPNKSQPKIFYSGLDPSHRTGHKQNHKWGNSNNGSNNTGRQNFGKRNQSYNGSNTYQGQQGPSNRGNFRGQGLRGNPRGVAQGGYSTNNGRGTNSGGELRRGADRREIQCFVCREFGHVARNCPKQGGQEGRPQNLNGVGNR